MPAHEPLIAIGRIVRETARRWHENDGGLLAASMAFYAAFSFFPLLLVVLAGLGYAMRFSSDAQGAEKELLGLVSENIAPAVAAQVAAILDGVRIEASFSGPIGLLVLFFGAVAMFNQLDFAFDRLWRVQPATGGIWPTVRRVIGSRLKAFVILCALGLLILAAFVLGIALSAAQRWAGHTERLGRTWEIIEFLAGVMFHVIVFALLFKLVPKSKVMWRHAFTGGIWVATVWEVGRITMAYIIAGSSYTPYGVVGSFIALMVWVYYASTLVFFGAQFVEVLENPVELPRVQSGGGPPTGGGKHR